MSGSAGPRPRRRQRQRRMLGRAMAVMLVVTVPAFSGCGAADPAMCPNDVPISCPAPAPTFAAQVAPLLAQRCGACHTAGGQSFNHPFDTYEQVHAERIGILSQLHRCLMPPADQPQPTPDERQTIFAWLVCGAMNN